MLSKTKLKTIFALLHRYSTYLKSVHASIDVIDVIYRLVFNEIRNQLYIIKYNILKIKLTYLFDFLDLFI